ncbi:MAG TPA: DUF1211 domain-containing protein [Actinobacteria bacterium]|nr:DUF1211 domain-containing protein [Actinomycetota bacterium]
MANEFKSGMTTSRVQALTDGVYAIAMTILVLNFEVPRVSKTSPALLEALQGFQLQFYDFMLSFFLLAVFWTVHHRQFHLIKKSDDGLLWINILSLAFVVLIPFTTSIYSEYRGVTIAAMLFELNIFLLGSMKFIQWIYITHNHRLVDPGLSQSTIENGKLLNLVTPVISMIAMVIALFAPDSSTLAFLFIPLLIRLVRK